MSMLILALPPPPPPPATFILVELELILALAPPAAPPPPPSIDIAAPPAAPPAASILAEADIEAELLILALLALASIDMARGDPAGGAGPPAAMEADILIYEAAEEDALIEAEDILAEAEFMLEVKELMELDIEDAELLDMALEAWLTKLEIALIALALMLMEVLTAPPALMLVFTMAPFIIIDMFISPLALMDIMELLEVLILDMELSEFTLVTILLLMIM